MPTLLLGTFGFAAFAAEKPAPEDQLMIAAQKICPVSGQDLVMMGLPVKTRIDGQIFFVCCNACTGRPGQQSYLARIKKNLREAQAECTVMKKPLPEDAKSVVAKGRLIFVCCPPCIQKIEAAPEKHTKVLNALYEKNLSTKRPGKSGKSAL